MVTKFIVKLEQLTDGSRWETLSEEELFIEFGAPAAATFPALCGWLNRYEGSSDITAELKVSLGLARPLITENPHLCK